LPSGRQQPAGIHDRLREAHAVTAKLLSDLIGETCRRFVRRPERKTARIERLIGSEAWTEVALALIDLELPQWQVRRIAYDEGEWHCALSRQRELPEWLDQSIEARHADAAAILGGSWRRRPRRAGEPDQRPHRAAQRRDHEPAVLRKFRLGTGATTPPRC
jgi:hypothetical protein